MFKKLFAGLAGIAFFTSMLFPKKTILDFRLEEFNLIPGPWFKEYLSDWMDAHDIYRTEDCTSGIAQGDETGDYIWVTDTPEWDRDWFEGHGFKFPQKWVPFAFLKQAVGVPGSTCKLIGL